jgi:hypothetical protein
MEHKVEQMYDCPFINKVGYKISDSCGGFDDTCNLMDGDDCLKETCPLQKDKSITVKWAGK